MRTKFLLTVFFCTLITTSFAQQSSSWTKWSWLMGEWKGEGNGKPGQGGGKFSFKTDLSEKILVRKSHSEYPAAGNKPAIIHDDLMIVYPDFSGNPSKAIYFDNEGHQINYSITYRDNDIILLSDKMPNMPVFRLTYSLLADKKINTKFEISQDGQNFTTYIEGKSSRI